MEAAHWGSQQARPEDAVLDAGVAAIHIGLPAKGPVTKAFANQHCFLFLFEDRNPDFSALAAYAGPFLRFPCACRLMHKIGPLRMVETSALDDKHTNVPPFLCLNSRGQPTSFSRCHGIFPKVCIG